MANFFEKDLARNAGGVNVALARAIYRHCADDLKAPVYYRNERHKSDGGGQRQTIFQTAATENYFLVIDLQVIGRLRLAFPDKNDRIHDSGVVWGNAGQGAGGKREKQVDLADDSSPEFRQWVFNLVDRVHTNAVEYYQRPRGSKRRAG
jgi:hypothetical protein